ncbi:MAG: hypothetical protein IJO65_04825 [Lachnospiraceae bacterium]|nr:hypothetical protein [Lachnospiraceae bacterium]
MTNRFTAKKNIFSYLSRIRFIYLLCPALLLIFTLALSSIEETAVEKQRESLETALTRNITHCYAVEGYYPPSLAYLEEHYGLTYDKELFFVDYQPVASNMRPYVTILQRKASS